MWAHGDSSFLIRGTAQGGSTYQEIAPTVYRGPQKEWALNRSAAVESPVGMASELDAHAHLETTRCAHAGDFAEAGRTGNGVDPADIGMVEDIERGGGEAYMGSFVGLIGGDSEVVSPA